MLANRPLSDSEDQRLGLLGKVRDQSSVPWGERIGVVLVHGRAGDESVMWVFSKAIEALDPIVFSPRAIMSDKIGGYSWWEIEEGARGSISENKEGASSAAGWLKLSPSMEAIERAISLLPEMYGVDPRRIIAIGFSQGGALIGMLSLARPSLFKGVAILASFIPNIARERYDHTDFETLPSYFMSHGTEDQIIPFEKALLTKEFLHRKAKSLRFHSDQVGHKISSSGTRELKEWIEGLLK